MCIGRGAFHVRRMRGASRAGARGKANVGISNDKGGGMPPRRKAKGSRATLIPGDANRPGVSRVLSRSRPGAGERTKRLIFRYCSAQRRGDGEVTRPPPDGIGG